MQIRVVKADNTVEQYLHTKVLGTFGNALALIDQPNVYAAEQFADAVTFHLYQKNDLNMITSEEIHIMVQAVLSATGYENAARKLNDFHLNRKLKRKRIEVIKDRADHSDHDGRSQWNKSKIVHWLMENKNVDYHVARAIASAVEQKVLDVGLLRIHTSLIEHFVLLDMEAMLNAQKELLTV